MKQRRTAHFVLKIEVCTVLHQHLHDLLACRIHESRVAILGDERTRYTERCEPRAVMNHERDWRAQVKQRRTAHFLLEIDVCTVHHQHRHDLYTSIQCRMHERRCAKLGDERTR